MKPGQDPATLRAIADELEHERFDAAAIASDCEAKAKSAPNVATREHYERATASWDAIARRSKLLARRLRARATRSERSS